MLPRQRFPLSCNDSADHCPVITGVLASNAATTMAAGLSDRLDLSRGHLMVARVGGDPRSDSH